MSDFETMLATLSVPSELRNIQAIEFKSDSIRKLTPIECERLQGFPDNHTKGVSDTQRYKQMGNTISVNVMEAIFKNLL